MSTFLMVVLFLLIGLVALVGASQVWARRAPKVHPLALELAQLINPFDATVHARIVASGHPTAEVAEAPLKEKLKKVESELEQARAARPALVQTRDEARDAFASSDSMSQTSPEFEAANEAQGALGSHDDRIADLRAVQVATLRMLGRDASDPDRQPAGVAADPRGDGSPWRSSVLADRDMQARLASIAGSKAKFGGIELGEVASRDALVTDITGTTAMRRGDWAGIVPQLRRRLSILDLIPTGTMDQNTFPYTQESGSFATAVETAEGTAKSEGALTLTDQEAVAQTIAHWLKLRKQALADTPALQTLVGGRLNYGVLRRLEGQILNGDGTGTNLLGILHTSGIGAVTFTSGQIPVEQILRGITTVMLADAEATGIVLNPLDWQAALLTKATYTALPGSPATIGGSGEYIGGGPFQTTAQQLWGVPLLSSVVIPQGTALVGDFALGAMLLIREGVQVLLSDSDADDFTTNRVTMLAEMRAALPVLRPPAFASVALQ